MSRILEDYLKEELPFKAILKNFIPIQEVKTIFEIGACEGEDTIKLSRTFTKAAIRSFEPLPKNLERLKYHIKKYDVKRVEVIPLALSNETGSASFHVSSGAPKDAPKDPEWDYGNKSSSLLSPQNLPGHYEWLQFKQTIDVQTMRLEEYCRENHVSSIDFVHMDVQGAELMVLEGAGALLPKIKAIWLEVENVELYKDQPLEDDVESFMSQNGFTCVFNTLSQVTGDKLYIHNSLLAKRWQQQKKPRGLRANDATRQALLSGAPKVTVLMSVYNSEKYLREAMDSILTQTYANFEFLIINDGSKDKSFQIISNYQDARIRVVSRENWGLTRSLNQGLQLAKGQYIARQDSDDASVPKRFEKEVTFLDEHPKAGMVGSNYTITDLKGKPRVTTNVFTHPADLKLCQVTCNQFGHGSVMMRKSVIDKVGGYDANVGYVEDYDLWTRISRVADIANFEEPLYLYKSNDQGVSLQNQELQIKQTFAVRDKAFAHFRKHRWQYRIYSYHPTGQDYRRRKSTLYRNLAYLYREDGSPILAAHMLLLAIAVQPKNKRNYRLLAKTLLKPHAPSWEFEFL